MSSALQALAVLEGALGFLAAADPGALTAAEQAECLRGLQRAESVRIAAQSMVLAAFEAGCGYAGDGHGTARSWLRWQGRVTGAAASVAVAWTRRLAEHPAVRKALAAGQVSESWARQICAWSDLLPTSARGDADVILLAAAWAGASLQDLAGLAEEMRARTAVPDSDGGGLPDRSLRLDVHYRGAGRLRGDLTPRCAAAVQAVLDALGKKQGPEDLRTRPQRDHDALEEACRRLIAAGMLPDRAGQSTQIQLHADLADLLGRPRGGQGTSSGPVGTSAGHGDTPPGRGDTPAGRSGIPAAGGGTTPGGSGPAGDSAGGPQAGSAQAGSAGGGNRAGAGAGAGGGPADDGAVLRSADDIARRGLFPGRDDLTGPWPAGYPGPGPMARPGDLCDASIVPFVTGHVDHELLARLAAALIASGTAGPEGLPPACPADVAPADYGDQPAGIGRFAGPSAASARPRLAGPSEDGPGAGPGNPGDHQAGPGPGDHGAGDHGAGDHGAGDHGAGDHGAGDHQAGHRRLSDALADGYARELVLRGAMALLSGPGGLASRLRTGTLTGPAGSISLPLDTGTATETVPPHLRRAVTLRDVHCAFPGCQTRHCQVHHIIPVCEGGPTRLDNLVLCCPFHHLIAIHEWGWKLALNADGTKTATSPDGGRALHSHHPPQAA